MEVLKMCQNDRETFLTMCQEFYSSNATSRGYDEQLANKTFDYLMSSHENLWGYLIKELGTCNPVGYCLLTSYWCNEDGGNVLIVDELYINANYRHRGYGKLILDWIEKEYCDRVISITLEVLTTNTIAKQLYHKQGYAEDGFEVLAKKIQK